MVSLFTLPNVSSTDHALVDISKWKQLSWPGEVNSKQEFTSWITNPSTMWQVYSPYEGINSNARISSSNHALYMKALVLDFDFPVEEPQEEIAVFVVRQCQRRGVPIPTLVSKTFSGGIRFVYEFEKPIMVHMAAHHAFLQHLTKEFRSRHICEGLDESALKDVNLLYCAPLRWTKIVDATPIQYSLLMHALVEASSKVKWRQRGAPAIPVHILSEELEAKFPNRWVGAFDIGARGVRFWDPSADNHTAAIVRETGMQCFTGPRAFMTWAEIFGSNFTKKYEDNRIGGAIEDIYFDGMTYWSKVGNDWMDFTRQDIQLQLKHRGLSNETQEHEVMSEIEKALVTVQTTMRVDAAVPMPHFPSGINVVQAKRFLNISSVQLIHSSSKCKKWGDGFKLLAHYFDGFFEQIDESFGATQLDFYLSWLKRFYVSCKERRPLPGQVVFTAGEVQSGKTFLSNVVMARLMGGSSDCSSFLLGETRFTGHLFAVPVWTIDDTRPGQDKAHANYSALIKKMPANQLFLYDDKFKRARMIPWLGRIMVSCNLDHESLRILPDIEQSLLDKIHLFKAAPTREGYDFHRLDKALTEELPAFAKWLEDWDPPEVTIEMSRFGVTSFHHPELLQAAKEVTSSHSFFEAFHMFMQSTFNEMKLNEWVGNASTMLKEMAMDDGMRTLTSHYTPRGVGRFIAQLAGQGVPLTQIRKEGLRMWSISKKDFETYCANLQPSSELKPVSKMTKTEKRPRKAS